MKWFVFFFVFCLFNGCKTKQNAAVESSKNRVQYVNSFHAGVRYKIKGQLDQAIKIFDSCFVAKPKDDAAAYGLAQCYQLQNNASQAITYLEKASGIDTENIAYTEELAFLYLSQNNIKQAEIQFKKLIEHDPKNLQWLFAYGDILKSQGKIEETVSLIDKITDQMGFVSELEVEKFSIYRAAKLDGKAENVLLIARKKHPNDVIILSTLTDFYLQTRRTTEATNLLQDLMVADPNNAPAQLALGQLYLRQGKKTNALPLFEKAFENPTLAIENKLAILSELFQGIPDEQCLNLAKNLTISDPENAATWAILGDYSLASNKRSEALTAFQTSLKKDDTNSKIWETTLLLEYDLEDFETLYFDSRKYSAIFPNSSNGNLFYAIACNKTQRHKEALTAVEQGINFLSYDPDMECELLAQRGEAFLKLKETDKGNAAFMQSFIANPSNAQVKNNYAYLLAALKLDFTSATKYINEAILIVSDAAEFYVTKGFISFQQGDYAASKADCEKAITLNLSYSNAYDLLGDNYILEKNTPKAIENWNLALNKGCKNKAIEQKIKQKKYLEAFY